LEKREQKITTILITLKNNPSLTANIVKSNAKSISQEYMDFLILNFYDPLQPKSCSCKSSVHIFEFIKEIFILETKFIENINDLVDSCPLLFKMIKSLFNKVELFDFLAVFLKKLLKKKYLKELVNEQYKNFKNAQSYKRGDTLNTRMFDGNFSQILNWKISSSKKYFRKFMKHTQKDFTKKRKLKKKKRKYEELVNNIYKKKNSSSNNCINSTHNTSNLNTQNGSKDFFSNIEQNIYDEMLSNKKSYLKQFNFHERTPDSNLTNLYSEKNTSYSGKKVTKRATITYF
jgi:hypothetical protein